MSDYADELLKRLDVSDPEPDEWRYVTLEGIRLGRVTKDADSRQIWESEPA